MLLILSLLVSLKNYAVEKNNFSYNFFKVLIFLINLFLRIEN